MRFITFTLTLFVLPIFAFAQEGFVALSPIPGLIETGANITSLPQYINNVFYFLITVGAIIAVFQLIRAGLLYMTVEAITEKKEARQLIQDAILGLVILLSITLILNIINTNLTSLDVLNFESRPSPSSDERPGFFAPGQPSDGYLDRTGEEWVYWTNDYSNGITIMNGPFANQEQCERARQERSTVGVEHYDCVGRAVGTE